ncbi:MAG: YfiR family protein [Cyclobacteriaceae bacterium]|nr:YfiR family protein [Cyclobacteriaceae bacterium]
MKKAKVVLAMLLLTMVSIQVAWAQKEKYHSILIYNFSKYVKWPDAQSSGNFVIGVLGNSKIEKELTDMASSKQVNGMSIEIKHFAAISQISGCHILYVSQEESAKIDEIQARTKGQAILLVTDKPGLAKRGAAINFVEVDGKIKFELNQQNVENRGLKVASSLSSLAILV